MGERDDTGWIAHFYLVPNQWCFPNLTELALIGPPPLKLAEPKTVPDTELPVTLYPHPSGCLGLVVVEGLDCPLEDAMKEAYGSWMGVCESHCSVATLSSGGARSPPGKHHNPAARVSSWTSHLCPLR